MARKGKLRPGVVLRFEWQILLEKMQSAEARDLFLMACLRRGNDPTYEPDLKDVENPFDQVRLESLWELAKNAIDADGANWNETVKRNQYSGYVSGCKQRGETPLPREDYEQWRNALVAKDPEIEEAIPY